MGKQIDAQKEHYAAITEQYENIRHMRHDIANHLHTINILLENGQNDEAAAYAAEIQNSGSYKSNLGTCKNPIADAFLYNRTNELRAQQIRVSINVVLNADTKIANADLISAFGNLLDNAAEACGLCENKNIALNASLKNGYLFIETQNPIPPLSGKEKQRRIPSLERGVGFHILQELAGKYGGEFKTQIKDDVFFAYLTLKEGKSDD